MAELLMFLLNSLARKFIDDPFESDESNSTHLLASFGPWQTAVILSMNVPVISKAFFIESVSSSRLTVMPASGSFPYKSTVALFFLRDVHSNQGYLINKCAHPLAHAQNQQIVRKQNEIAVSMIRTHCNAAHVNDVAQSAQFGTLPIADGTRQYLKFKFFLSTCCRTGRL